MQAGGMSAEPNNEWQTDEIETKPSRSRAVTCANVVGKKLTLLIHKDPASFRAAAQYEFSIALQSMSLDVLDLVEDRLNLLHKKLISLEKAMRDIVISRDADAQAREMEAIFTAEQERSEKSLLAQWLQGFVYHLPKVRTKTPCEFSRDLDLGLDAVDFALCRYALNVAISSSNVPREKVLLSRIHLMLNVMIDRANTIMVTPISDRNSI